jgi:hypothetical protein
MSIRGSYTPIEHYQIGGKFQFLGRFTNTIIYELKIYTIIFEARVGKLYIK